MREFIVLLLSFGLLGTADAASATLKRIKDRGEIRVGYDAAEPFSFEGADGQATGYSVELCGRVAEAVRTNLGLKELKISHVSLTVAERFDAVASGKVDILCSGSTITLGRMEKVDFSLMIFVTGGGVMSRASAPVALISDLAGKRVAVTAGTTAETALATFLKDNFIDAEIVTADSNEAALGMLDQGQVDAVANDQIVLIGQLVASGEPRNYAIAEDLYSYEPYGLVVPHNDGEFRLVVDRALARIYRTGQFKPLYDKWFGRIGLRPTPILQAMYKIKALPE
jgi:glutamate/aspartate transport system substrate-binding protein